MYENVMNSNAVSVFSCGRHCAMLPAEKTRVRSTGEGVGKPLEMRQYN